MSYDNGKIYIIGSPSSQKYYIGSTIKSLDARLKKHKSCYKRWVDGTYHNCYSFELLKYGDCYIKLIEYCPCNSKQELDRREGLFQLESKDFIVNKNIAGRTRAEYRNLHKAEIAEQNKLYHQSHKAERAEYQKLYRPQINAKQRLNRQRKLIQIKNGKTDKATFPIVPQILEEPESC